MNQYNLIIIGFIAASFLLLMWWTFNTIRRIEIQKNNCAVQLTSIAKLWHRAKFVPEDAKERESLYLYRDFLRKFEESEGQYPVIVKEGKVRCMTRKEYDNLIGQKDISPFSVLFLIISLMIAGGAVFVNFYFTKTLWLGVVLALILPVLQLFLAIFIARFNRDKNNYRDGIFMALKENSVHFLSITKPFIIVDAYPDKFGKNKRPLYATIGELPEEQIIESRDFIIRQKEAERTTPRPELKNASETIENNQEDIKEVEHINVAENASENEIQPNEIISEEKDTSEDEFLEFDKENLVNNLIDDMLEAEVNRAEKKEEKAMQEQQKPEKIEVLEPLPVDTMSNVEVPAEDDFSLEAIGQALDAEIARRHKK
ncbi:MAG: hypothetical protein MJ054_00085 [Clostridia bacterium]|nr:hypothetical protein [Clostridia bacterium]